MPCSKRENLARTEFNGNMPLVAQHPFLAHEKEQQAQQGHGPERRDHGGHDEHRIGVAERVASAYGVLADADVHREDVGHVRDHMTCEREHLQHQPVLQTQAQARVSIDMQVCCVSLAGCIRDGGRRSFYVCLDSTVGTCAR